jgi:hypothetical protein
MAAPARRPAAMRFSMGAKVTRRIYFSSKKKISPPSFQILINIYRLRYPSTEGSITANHPLGQSNRPSPAVQR